MSTLWTLPFTAILKRTDDIFAALDNGDQVYLVHSRKGTVEVRRVKQAGTAMPVGFAQMARQPLELISGKKEDEEVAMMLAKKVSDMLNPPPSLNSDWNESDPDVSIAWWPGRATYQNGRWEFFINNLEGKRVWVYWKTAIKVLQESPQNIIKEDLNGPIPKPEQLHSEGVAAQEYGDPDAPGLSDDEREAIRATNKIADMLRKP